MKKPNFLKIISEEAIHFPRLLVPEDFAREHFNRVSISANVILMVPGGRKWEIELSKSNGQMSLQNGWGKFAQDLSLKLGYSVVFRYDGGCRFHVLIFDGSREIEYPPSNCRKRGRGRPSLPESQPCKARKSHSTHEPVKNLTSEPKSPDVKRRRKMKKALENGENYTPSSSSSSPFKSGYPHFKVEIPPDGTKELNIPDWFAREHLSRFGNVKLEVSNGRTWTVVLSLSQPPNKPRPVAKFLGLTWKTFAKDNNLKEGDICHFELVKTDLFKVVLESTSGGKSCPQPRSSMETNKSVKESRSFTSEVRSTVDKYMYIPTWFSSKHLIGSNQVKLRVSSGRTWTVSLGFAQRENSQLQARLFGASWKEFVLDNNLYVGRVCVFELIKGKEEHLLDVSFPTSNVGHLSATTSDVKRRREIKKAVENGENHTPSSSSPFKSGYPHFKVEIPPEGTKELNIPDWFARDHLSRTGNVKLEMSNGRTWTVVLSFSQPPNKPRPVAKFLGLTWKTFAKDNNLKEGDICHFELVKTDSFKVVLESTSGGKSCPQPPSSLETNKENPSFTNEVRSTVHKYMYIPTWFANEHLIGRNQVKLRVSSGRTWIVSVGIAYPPRNSRPIGRLFGDSWKEFVLDNNLYVGRVCVFELIKGKEEPLLDVSFPTSSLSHHLATTSGKKIPPQRPNSHGTNQPCEGSSFTKIIPPSGIRGGSIRLPADFTNKHLPMLMEDTNVRLVVEGKFWDMKLLIRLQPHRYGILHRGWSKFAKDNGLKSGDGCVFHLIRASDVVVMKVFIKRR